MCAFTIRFIRAILKAEFCFYWIHHLSHRNSFLLPFHAVHHSSQLKK
ncbi:MAG: sterol desaturase family protein [Flavobacteriales bacterium]|nr:sterol desaturase family protein [Flavobacteriales bacterium]